MQDSKAVDIITHWAKHAELVSISVCMLYCDLKSMLTGPGLHSSHVSSFTGGTDSPAGAQGAGWVPGGTRANASECALRGHWREPLTPPPRKSPRSLFSKTFTFESSPLVVLNWARRGPWVLGSDLPRPGGPVLSSRQGHLLQETAPRGWRVTGGKELEAQGLGRGCGTGGKGAWPPEPLWPSEPQAARPSWAPGAGPCSRGGARRMKRPPWVARGGRQTPAPGRTDRQPLEGASRGRAPRAGKQRPGPQPGPARDTRERPGWSRERRAGKRRVLGCSRTPTGAASRPRAPAGHKDGLYRLLQKP